jgi:hypothetical protein
MLIDQILGDPNWQTRKGMTVELRGRLSKATKFVLRPDFAIAADQFRNDLDNLEKGRRFCRLPFAECWFEVAHADRRIARITATPDNMMRKKRIGYLLTQTDHDGSFEGRLFVSLHPEASVIGYRVNRPEWITAPTRLRYDSHSSSFDTAYKEREIYSTGASVEQLRIWWQGESRYLTAVLELLQSKNATDISPLVDFSRVNHQRAQRNKPLFFSYHIVSIPERYKQRHIADGSGREIRAHYVRGHFKVRKTGIFFWSAYQRGNPTLGFVHKDYELHAPGSVMQ